MRAVLRGAALSFVALMGVFGSGCGGGGNSIGGGGGSQTPVTPTVTLTPASSTISTVQALKVTVTVSGGAGTPTGSVTLSVGSFTSSAVTLAAGSAAITIPAGSLAAGSVTLKGSYTPDSGSSSAYNSASGTAPVTVSLATPTVNVTPASQSIVAAQALQVTVNVSGGSGAPAPTGNVVLSAGSYKSAAAALSAGSASISIPANTFAVGSVTLSAAYTPDAAGAALYQSATGQSSAINVYQSNTVTVDQSGTGARQGQTLA